MILDNKEQSSKNNKILFLMIIIIVILVFLSLIISFTLIFLNYNKNNNFAEKLEKKGFTDLNEHFICDAINKNSTLMMSTRKYSFIAINGEVFNMSFTTTYDNNQNCQKRDFETKLKSHIDDVVIGDNGKYYSIYENLIEKKDISFDYDTKDIIQKVDKYILKKDGNIYYQEKPNEPIKLKYKRSSFKGKIQSISLISSDYSEGDEKKILVLTSKAVYYSYLENEEKCLKNSNIVCHYEMKKDNFLSKNRNKIFFIDDTNIITKDGKVLYTNNYFKS